MSVRNSIQDIESGRSSDSAKIEPEAADIDGRNDGDTGPETQDGNPSGSETEHNRLQGWDFYVLMTSVTLGVLLISFNATALGTVRDTTLFPGTLPLTFITGDSRDHVRV